MKNSTAVAWLLMSVTGIAQAADSPATGYASTGDQTLAALIADALARNPGIQEAQFHHIAAEQQVRRATALPDPRLAFTHHAQPPETRVGPQINGITVNQTLPWFGKRVIRGNVAAGQAAALRAGIETQQVDVVADVKRGYYELAYLDRAIGIASEEAELLRHYETLARARYSQGIGLQQAVVKLQAEITRVMNRQHEFRRQRVDVEAKLNALRDRPVQTVISAVQLGPRPTLRVDYERLLALGRDRRPELRAARARVASAKDAIGLARRAYWPDLVVGATWGDVANRRDRVGRTAPPAENGKDVFSVSVGVSIPIGRSTLRAGVDAASARFAAAQQAYREAATRVEQAIRTTTFDIEALDQQIALVEHALLPQAEQALSTTEDAYSTGTVGVLDLLDSEEVLLDVRLGLARLEADYFRALADMERAVGTAFPEEDRR